MIYKFLFPLKPDSMGASAFLLILRISFGLLLMNHGIQKWSNFQELSTSVGIRFSPLLGVGHLCRVSMFDGLYYRFSLQVGHDSNDLYYGYCILCYSCK